LTGCGWLRFACVLHLSFVDRYRLGYAVLFNRFLEIPLGRGLVAPGAQKKVDRIAFLVYGPVELLPNAPNLHVGFVHPPVFANGTLAAAEHLLKDRQKLDGPAMHGGMVDRNPTLRHHFRQMDAS